MAKMTDFAITFEFEPIVKLRCGETLCRYNMVKMPGHWLACNLKDLEILPGGRCGSFEVQPRTRLEETA